MLSANRLVAGFILYLHSKEVQSFIVTVSSVSCVILRHNLTDSIRGGGDMDHGYYKSSQIRQGEDVFESVPNKSHPIFLFAPLQL